MLLRPFSLKLVFVAVFVGVSGGGISRNSVLPSDIFKFANAAEKRTVYEGGHGWPAAFSELFLRSNVQSTKREKRKSPKIVSGYTLF